MKVFSVLNAAKHLARSLKKPVIFLAFPGSDEFDNGFKETLKAAPYLDMNDGETLQAIFDGQAIIVCKDEKEQRMIYNLTVGDDGPTPLNKYDGKARIYALTIDATGQSLNENT